MGTSEVAIIFGVGSNIGTAVAKGFVDAGYRVATVSRSSPSSADSSSNPYHIQADLSDPAAVTGVFDKVKSAGLDFPSVVVWNAASLTPPPEPENPLSLADADLDKDISVMIKSPYAAARAAVKVWQGQSGKDGRKGTFIMTGNLLPKQIPPVALYTSLGIGKSGANFWVGIADGVLKNKGIRFFFADERTKDGAPVGKTPDGAGHSSIFLSMVEGKEDLPYYVTFVDGKYRKFD
ncbi:short-chain dehydrogenase reductase sdr [Diaporthe amygdali]|uniref:short-chain dehydrogenase reductase sdr n=1 Tax=Phomopsis amygdali TaxID=1214568 RepID=UPI0022FE5429|nr:short-chain dehydrogenase reductase sdr [Diaporthe amygdali]KAJ0119309.1 short-chain dehydrogenase reductase sdr [Diaporthe amygdali]